MSILDKAQASANCARMDRKPKSPAHWGSSTLNVLIAAGIATGIGSAALVAALFRTNRGELVDTAPLESTEPTG